MAEIGREVFKQFLRTITINPADGGNELPGSRPIVPCDDLYHVRHGTTCRLQLVQADPQVVFEALLATTCWPLLNVCFHTQAEDEIKAPIRTHQTRPFDFPEKPCGVALAYSASLLLFASVSRIHLYASCRSMIATGRSSRDKLLVVLNSSPSLYTRCSVVLYKTPFSPGFSKIAKCLPNHFLLNT